MQPPLQDISQVILDICTLLKQKDNITQISRSSRTLIKEAAYGESVTPLHRGDGDNNASHQRVLEGPLPRRVFEREFEGFDGIAHCRRDRVLQENHDCDIKELDGGIATVTPARKEGSRGSGNRRGRWRTRCVVNSSPLVT